MRQYAGFGTAAESNRATRSCSRRGTTGLSVAFDLPTQMGYDSDAPWRRARSARSAWRSTRSRTCGCCSHGIPLDEVTTSMTINAPAAMLLLLYALVAEEQGVAPEQLAGTIQNDILKEYIARGTYIYPPRPSLRLVSRRVRATAGRVPQWNTISI